MKTVLNMNSAEIYEINPYLNENPGGIKRRFLARLPVIKINLFILPATMQV